MSEQQAKLLNKLRLTLQLELEEKYDEFLDSLSSQRPMRLFNGYSDWTTSDLVKAAQALDADPIEIWEKYQIPVDGKLSEVQTALFEMGYQMQFVPAAAA